MESEELREDPTSDLKDLGNCKVLIIEDEVLMSALLLRYIEGLSRSGLYGKLRPKVLTSGWELLKTDLSQVRVAIVDILLPQITGVDLIKDFRARFPNMGIVPLSGMATSPMQRALKEVLPRGISLLPKPLHKDEFLAAFHKAWNYQQPLSTSPTTKKEVGEELWTTVSQMRSNEISIEHRKLLRKRAA